MSAITEIVDRYIAMWNDDDAPRRKALIGEIWTERGRYVDPVLKGEGRDGIDAMVQAVRAKYPGCRFTRTGPVDAHNDTARFAWSLGASGGAVMVTGIDFVTLRGGLLDTVTGYFDQAAGAAAAA